MKKIKSFFVSLFTPGTYYQRIAFWGCVFVLIQFNLIFFHFPEYYFEGITWLMMLIGFSFSYFIHFIDKKTNE